MITAWDPGDTTGYAVWNDQYDLVEMGQIPLEEVPTIWAALQKRHGQPTLTIIEDYILFGKRAISQAGSRMKAPQGIGMLKALSAVQSIPVVLQDSNKKDIGYKFLGIKAPSKHSDSHEYDAVAHGEYYLVKNKFVRTTLERQKANAAKK